VFGYLRDLLFVGGCFLGKGLLIHSFFVDSGGFSANISGVVDCGRGVLICFDLYVATVIRFFSCLYSFTDLSTFFNTHRFFACTFFIF